jgi:hypothetical protein
VINRVLKLVGAERHYVFTTLCFKILGFQHTSSDKLEPEPGPVDQRWSSILGTAHHQQPTWTKVVARSPHSRGRLSTVDPFALSSLDLLILILKHYLLFYKTSYPNGEVNRTKPSPLVSFPWLRP